LAFASLGLRPAPQKELEFFIAPDEFGYTLPIAWLIRCRHLVVAVEDGRVGYDNVAKRYASILARHGVELEIRHSAGAVQDLNLLRDPASGVQAALTTFGFTYPGRQAKDAAAGFTDIVRETIEERPCTAVAIACRPWLAIGQDASADLARAHGPELRRTRSSVPP
jgi:hypothetical protein